MPPSAPPITFRVPSRDDAGATRARRAAEPEVPYTAAIGTVKQSVRVGTTRSGGHAVGVDAVPGQDVVVLQIAGGPELFLHPEHGLELMRAQSAVPHQRGAGREVDVPLRLQWRGLEDAPGLRGTSRGRLGDVVLSAIHVLTGAAEDDLADFAASKIVQAVDRQVEPDVYALSPDALTKAKGRERVTGKVPSNGGDPVLVFVHGTFSTTHGTFGKLWIDHPQRVRSLFDRYKNRVYALDHPTLGESPIENALRLAEKLPDKANLHLVTHSRGGLVAEVLAHARGTADDRFEAFAVEGYAEQRKQLKALAAMLAKKHVEVSRVVRVACPARGTLLASRRLDAYLSVFKWTLELAGIPVAPELLGFIGAVAKRRADPEVIPGLAAQMPNSPLVQWLHSAERRIDGQLRVVAGDLEGDSVTSWLKTLMADAFFWTDNDLVVQTRSMYGGSPRETASTFVLDQGGKVSHFNYFSNERTSEAIVSALVDDVPAGFSTIGPLSWAGETSVGTRAARKPAKPAAAAATDRPAVFILPGILGSNLKIGDDRIWVGWRLVNGFKRLKYSLGGKDGVEPDGPIASVYDDLASFLMTTHEVMPFAFDWRRPIEEEAARLGDGIEAALDARRDSGAPVRIVAHSMGGLVARAVQFERPKVWKRMFDNAGARLLMLGTPNAGSYAPMQVLSGDDTFGNVLATIGAPFQEHGARALIAGFPGLLQLQADLLGELGKADAWKKLAADDLEKTIAKSWWHSLPEQRESLRWGVPGQAVLDLAIGLRKKLDAQLERELTGISDKVVLVVGLAPFTPVRYDPSDGMYVGTNTGDGRVTLESAMLPGVRTWRLDCEHSGLPDRKPAFAAYAELLESGTTRLLESVPAATRTRGTGAAAAPALLLRSRPSRTARQATPPSREGEALHGEGDSRLLDERPPTPALQVAVLHGDLTYVHQPLLVGHYRSLRLTGTEDVMNRRIGGSMAESLRVGTYPEGPGTHKVFVNTRVNDDNPLDEFPRPQAVIVVGLGQEGELRGSDLVQTIRQGVIAWAERLAERPKGGPIAFELAATLIGSGGTRISAGQAAQWIAQGVREANERLSEDSNASSAAGLARVSRLTLVELYLDRASEAWRALQLQAAATPGHYAVEDTVRTGVGGLPRPLDAAYRGAPYDFISAVGKTDAAGGTEIEYILDTRRARTEVRAQKAQGPLLRHLVMLASNDANTDPQIGHTLFQLVVPIELEPFFAGTTEMQIEVDSTTAGIPWEVLDTRAGAERGAPPWAIRAKLLRKLRMSDRQFRAHPVDADPSAHVLVIGEPKCNTDLYPRLPSAREEAREVVTCFEEGGADHIKGLISPDDPDRQGPDARRIINALMERPWRVVHIAGHGEPPEGGDPRGVVLSDNTFLGPREIENMRVVPELVFVNCCHLAARDPDQVLTARDDRARFAAGVAEKLIGIGVRCVVAAGWAVDDAAAGTFASTFYKALLGRRRFLDAVAAARQAAFAHGGNTWAAYQCYGDPDWTLRRDLTHADRPTVPEALTALAAAPALVRALETIAIDTSYNRAGVEKQRDRIRYLFEHYGRRWGRRGDVAEAFAAAHLAVKNREEALTWYRRAVAANDGTATIRAAEQLANLQARMATKREDIETALRSLERLVAVAPSMERRSLCGSACKRLALLEEKAGRPRAAAEAIARMEKHYAAAEALGRRQGLDFFYPAMNRIAAALVLNAGRKAWKGLDAKAVESVRAALNAKATQDPDFWGVVGQTELTIYEAIAGSRLAGTRKEIAEALETVHERVADSWWWSSVYDNARFILPPYMARTTAAEKKAAAALLALLERWATPADAAK